MVTGFCAAIAAGCSLPLGREAIPPPACTQPKLGKQACPIVLLLLMNPCSPLLSYYRFASTAHSALRSSSSFLRLGQEEASSRVWLTHIVRLVGSTQESTAEGVRSRISSDEISDDHDSR